MSRILDVLQGRPRDLGGFTVRRVLPIGHRLNVGPFIFFDHMGPLRLPPGQGLDVRPHPHIGLATVTYLFQGRFEHRDSLGTVQTISPGDVNWMTAGAGIVHSERSPQDDRASGAALHGIQSWVALPRELEECAPAFAHHPAASLPRREQNGVKLCVIAGEAYGLRSPVAVATPTLYVEVQLTAGATLALPEEHAERALYVVAGEVQIEDQRFSEGVLPVFAPGVVSVQALRDTHLMLLGGATLDAPRKIWWNLVSSRPERIEQAKDDWKAQRFAKVLGETEFIPLPEG